MIEESLKKMPPQITWNNNFSPVENLLRKWTTAGLSKR
jgi:hypothetical protein